jgi:hypothetical protein
MNFISTSISLRKMVLRIIFHQVMEERLASSRGDEAYIATDVWDGVGGTVAGMNQCLFEP